jgi:hypothetical protein
MICADFVNSILILDCFVLNFYFQKSFTTLFSRVSIISAITLIILPNSLLNTNLVLVLLLQYFIRFLFLK